MFKGLVWVLVYHLAAGAMFLPLSPPSTHTRTRTRTRIHAHAHVYTYATRARTLAVGQIRALEEWCPCSLRDRDVEIHLHIHVHAHAHTHAPHARAHGQLVKAQHWRDLHYLLSVLPNSAFLFKCSAAEVVPPTVAMLAEATAPVNKF